MEKKINFRMSRIRGKDTTPELLVTPDTISKVNQARDYIFSKIKEISDS